jgi:hypothetical protein
VFGSSLLTQINVLSGTAEMLTHVLVNRQFDLVIMRDSLKPCIDPGLALANAYRDVPGDGCDLRASRQERACEAGQPSRRIVLTFGCKAIGA